MTNRQKTLLPKKLEMLALKLKSYAFMKIFMVETSSPMRDHKVRHYDLELEGATAISSWLKGKLQQVYIRCLYQFKEWKKLKQHQPKPPIAPSQSFHHNSATMTQISSPNKQIASRVKCMTDRDFYVEAKTSKDPQNNHKPYRSEFGDQSQLSQSSRKSNLESLLHKVKQVNTQAKLDKENEQQKANFFDGRDYGMSYNGSRVLSSGTGMADHKKLTNRSKQFAFKPSSFYNDSISFNGYQPADRHQSTTNINSTCYIKDINTPNSKVQKIYSRLDLQEQECLDKNNLMSLKKWHKNQKRHAIMSKINQLENSLVAEYSKPDQEYYFGNGDDEICEFGESGMMDKFSATQMPGNYSQAYLRFRARQPPRSVVDGRLIRKY